MQLRPNQLDAHLTKPLAPMTFIQDLLKLLIDLPSFVEELQGVIL